MQNHQKTPLESSDSKKEDRLLRLYEGTPPLHFDTWRKKRLKNGQPAEIKNFRESEEYKVFVKQLTTVIMTIKHSFLARQAEEPFERKLSDEQFKPLDELAKRLLDPTIVSDEMRQGVSEAAQMYSEGKRYLEELLHHVETAPFSTVSGVMKSLLEKEKNHNASSLSVCASGTRQNLQDALAEFSDQMNDRIKHATLASVKQFAYEFMVKTPPVLYQLNEIHMNATLVNYFYAKTRRVAEGKKIIQDPFAHPPVTDDKILFLQRNGVGYRVRFTQKEADRFVKELNSYDLNKAILERMTMQLHRDMRTISSYDGASFFLKELIKLAGDQQENHSIVSLRQRFFGYYKIARIRYAGQFVLNDYQKQEIDDYGVWVALSFLKRENQDDPGNFRKELQALCDVIASHPHVDRAKLSKNVLKIYDDLQYELLSKTIIKNLDPYQVTQDRDIFKYLHEQLLKALHDEEKKAETTKAPSSSDKARQDKRLKIFEAYMQRQKLPLSELKKVPDKKEKKEESPDPEIRFGTARTLASATDISLDNKQYCSLDQIVKDKKSTQLDTVQTTETVYKTLRETVFFLMLDGGHFDKMRFVELPANPFTKDTFYFDLNCLELSWILHINESDAPERCLFVNLDSSQQLAVLKQLCMSDAANIPWPTFKKIFDSLTPFYKKTPIITLDQFSEDERLAMRTDVLARFALQKDAHAIETLYKKLGPRYKKIPTSSASTGEDILAVIALLDNDPNTKILLQLENTFLKDIIWTQSLFLACYAMGKRDFSGLILKNMTFNGEDLSGINLQGAILENINFHDVNFHDQGGQIADFKGATLKNVTFPSKKFERGSGTIKFRTYFRGERIKKTVIDEKTFLSLYKIGVRNFDHMVLDNIDFRKMDFSEPLSFIGSSLKGANFDKQDLTKCDFVEADLSNANLRNAVLEKYQGHSRSLSQRQAVNFCGTNLQGADLTDASGDPIMGCKVLHDVEHQLMGRPRTQMDAVSIKTFLTFHRHKVRNFRNVDLIVTSTNHTPDLQSINFGQSCLGRDQLKLLYANGVRNFSKVNFYGQNLSGLDLRDADFSEALLECTDFSGSNLKGARFTKATIGSEPYNLTLFNNTIYDRLNGPDLVETLPYLSYQGATPLQTLQNLLEQAYLKGGIIYRMFTWRSYVPEAIAMIDYIKSFHSKSSPPTIHEVFTKIFREGLYDDKFGKMLKNRSSMLCKIYKFCLVFEGAFEESRQDVRTHSLKDAQKETTLDKTTRLISQ